MKCPKCGCEIRIQTDVCPFCGLVLPVNVQNTYNGAQHINFKTQTATPFSNKAGKHACKKRRLFTFLKGGKADNLPFDKRTELYQEIIIILLFVLIITNIIEIIILLKI